MPEHMDLRIHGLRELNRALKNGDRELHRKLQDRFRAIAASIAVGAREIAEAKDIRETGDLIRSIRPFVRQAGAGVMVTATHHGYPYPGRIEFEGRIGGRGSWGPRGFLSPAYEDRRNSVFDAAERLLDDFADDFARER